MRFAIITRGTHRRNSRARRRGSPHRDPRLGAGSARCRQAHAGARRPAVPLLPERALCARRLLRSVRQHRRRGRRLREGKHRRMRARALTEGISIHAGGPILSVR